MERGKFCRTRIDKCVPRGSRHPVRTEDDGGCGPAALGLGLWMVRCGGDMTEAWGQSPGARGIEGSRALVADRPEPSLDTHVVAGEAFPPAPSPGLRLATQACEHPPEWS